MEQPSLPALTSDPSVPTLPRITIDEDDRPLEPSERFEQDADESFFAAAEFQLDAPLNVPARTTPDFSFDFSALLANDPNESTSTERAGSPVGDDTGSDVEHAEVDFQVNAEWAQTRTIDQAFDAEPFDLSPFDFEISESTPLEPIQISSPQEPPAPEGPAPGRDETVHSTASASAAPVVDESPAAMYGSLPDTPHLPSIGSLLSTSPAASESSVPSTPPSAPAHQVPEPFHEVPEPPVPVLDVAPAIPHVEPQASVAPVYEPAAEAEQTPAVDRVSPPIDPTPTTAFVPTAATAPAAAPQSPPGLPSLPGPTQAPPAPSPAPAHTQQPNQVGMMPPMGAPVTPGKPVVKKPTRHPVRTMFRGVVAVALAAGAGAAAHIGYDWWEARDGVVIEASEVDGADLAAWPVLDPPAIRYADTVTVFRDAGGERVVTAHREIATGSVVADVRITDSFGAELGQAEVEVRGDEGFARAVPDVPFTPMAPSDALAALGTTWSPEILTARELFPEALMPYATVLESVERVLPITALEVPRDPGAAAAAAIAPGAARASTVWQYRVVIDTEAFRIRRPAEFQQWESRVGQNAAPRLEAWIDQTGVVRQIAVEVDGVSITHTLVGGSSVSDEFVRATPTAGESPVEAPAGTEVGS